MDSFSLILKIDSNMWGILRILSLYFFRALAAPV